MDSSRGIVQQVERIFWIGCAIGFGWGVAIGTTFGLWLAWS